MKQLITMKFSGARLVYNRRGSMALEQVLFIGAAIFVAATGLTMFFRSLDQYLCGFNDDAMVRTECLENASNKE